MNPRLFWLCLVLLGCIAVDVLAVVICYRLTTLVIR